MNYEKYFWFVDKEEYGESKPLTLHSANTSKTFDPNYPAERAF